jgi:hypothetical protein
MTPNPPVHPFNIVSPRQLSKEDEMLEVCRGNLIAFGKLFLPADFKRSESPAFHYEISEALLSLGEDSKQLAIFVPRGHAKSTLIKAYILHDFCFRNGRTDPHFFGWVSDSISKSRRNVEYVANHVLHNKRIHRYFPHVEAGRPYGKTWTKEDITLANDDTLISRSNLKSLRGETSGTVEGGVQRYYRIFLDDVENEENTKTLEARTWIKKTITNAIFPALITPTGRLVLTMTPVHYDSFCQNVIDEWNRYRQKCDEDAYSYRVIYYPATQPNMEGGVLWNDLFPRPVLDQKRKFYEDNGNLAGYYQEYELQPQGQENRVWTREHYKLHDAVYKWDEERHQGFLTWNDKTFAINTFIGCDPATDIESFNVDDSSFTVVAYDAHRNIYVLEQINEKSLLELALRDAQGNILGKGKPGVVDLLFTLYDKYHCSNATLEDVGMTRGVWQSLEAEKYRRNRYDVIVLPIKPEGKEKRDKIKAGLNALFVQGLIHVREDMYVLREQIEEFGPQLPHDDSIESLFFATRNLVLPNENISIFSSVRQFLRPPKSWHVL